MQTRWLPFRARLWDVGGTRSPWGDPRRHGEIVPTPRRPCCGQGVIFSSFPHQHYSKMPGNQNDVFRDLLQNHLRLVLQSNGGGGGCGTLLDGHLLKGGPRDREGFSISQWWTTRPGSQWPLRALETHPPISGTGPWSATPGVTGPFQSPLSTQL